MQELADKLGLRKTIETYFQKSLNVFRTASLKTKLSINHVGKSQVLGRLLELTDLRFLGWARYDDNKRSVVTRLCIADARNYEGEEIRKAISSILLNYWEGSSYKPEEFSKKQLRMLDKGNKTVEPKDGKVSSGTERRFASMSKVYRKIEETSVQGLKRRWRSSK